MTAPMDCGRQGPAIPESRPPSFSDAYAGRKVCRTARKKAGNARTSCMEGVIGVPGLTGAGAAGGCPAGRKGRPPPSGPGHGRSLAVGPPADSRFAASAVSRSTRYERGSRQSGTFRSASGIGATETGAPCDTGPTVSPATCRSPWRGWRVTRTLHSDSYSFTVCPVEYPRVSDPVTPV